MNSETIIVGISCLFLVVAFFMFKTQLFILLNRLANIEIRNKKNPKADLEAIVPKDNKPWTWHKAWITSLLHPNADTSKALSSEGNISFLQSYIWIVAASVVFQFLYSIILWIKFPYPINNASALIFLENCFLAGLFSPISIVIITGFIHVLAKLFGSKKSFQSFFIVYVAFNAPVMILYITMALIWQVFRLQVTLYLGMISIFYFLFIVTTKAIKSYYQLSWLKGFFINLFVQAVSFFSIISLVIMLYPSIIKR